MFLYEVRGKQFAAVCAPEEKYQTYGGHELVNLKCDPRLSQLFQAEYPEVLPGFYCDKKNWIAALLDGDLPDQVLWDLCEQSYRLAVARLPKYVQPGAGRPLTLCKPQTQRGARGIERRGNDMTADPKQVGGYVLVPAGATDRHAGGDGGLRHRHGGDGGTLGPGVPGETALPPQGRERDLVRGKGGRGKRRLRRGAGGYGGVPLGRVCYGPYQVVEDPTAVPEEFQDSGTGSGVRQGDEVTFGDAVFPTCSLTRMESRSGRSAPMAT